MIATGTQSTAIINTGTHKSKTVLHAIHKIFYKTIRAEQWKEYETKKDMEVNECNNFPSSTVLKMEPN